MPNFDFRCQACSHVFEFSRPFGSKEVPPCPICESKEVEKVVTPPAIQFKGSGFYKTDAAKKTSSPSIPSTAPAKEKTETKQTPPSEKPKEAAPKSEKKN